MNQFLGIDVGGTKIAAGLVRPVRAKFSNGVNQNYKISNLLIQPTSQTNLTGQLIRLIKTFKNFDAIGLGVPGQVLQNGTVTKLPHVKKFKPTNLKTILQKKFKKPVSIINDAKAFAFAEALLGAGKKSKIIVGVILGTGIGTGIVIDKKIFFGADGIAGDIGHFPMIEEKIIGQRRREVGFFTHAAQVKKYLKLLASCIVLSFNPDVIVLGGAWSKLPDMKKIWTDSVKTLMFPTKTKIFISKLPQAGVIGAVLPLLKK